MENDEESIIDEQITTNDVKQEQQEIYHDEVHKFVLTSLSIKFNQYLSPYPFFRVQNAQYVVYHGVKQVLIVSVH